MKKPWSFTFSFHIYQAPPHTHNIPLSTPEHLEPIPPATTLTTIITMSTQTKACWSQLLTEIKLKIFRSCLISEDPITHEKHKERLDQIYQRSP
jgi:hypothetical protein